MVLLPSPRGEEQQHRQHPQPIDVIRVSGPHMLALSPDSAGIVRMIAVCGHGPG